VQYEGGMQKGVVGVTANLHECGRVEGLEVRALQQRYGLAKLGALGAQGARCLLGRLRQEGAIRHSDTSYTL